MDKNVSGVDLEELIKAREELDREKGVEADPNLYSDVNNESKNLDVENQEEMNNNDNYENTKRQGK